MRSALTLALFIPGLIAFIVFGTASLAGGQTTTVVVGDNWYCEASFENGVCETTIDAGTTVLWDYASGNTVHTVTECGDSLDDCNPSPRLWHSGSLASGQTFSRTFDTVGTFLYRCQIHPVQMRGRIVVQKAPEATPTAAPSATPTAEPTATPAPAEPIATPAPADSPAVAGEAPATPTPVVEGAVTLPVGGGSPPGAGYSSYVWLVVAGGSFLIIALGAASVVLSRRSRR